MKSKGRDALAAAAIESAKLNALLGLTLRILLNDTDFSSNRKRRQGANDLVRYLAGFGLDAKEIAQIMGTPVQSVRTLLTPKRRKK